MKYTDCPATSQLVKSAMMSVEESQYFAELAQHHKLSERSIGEQVLFVHLFLLSINIRRESEKLHENRGDLSLMLKMISLHATMSDKLGLTASKRGIRNTDPFGIGDFMEGVNEA